ncbi:membrane protein [Streptomyces viridiviolaceus]|uniref:HXXEE domain-containing protein n=1 Tax=Streptomyces viridiviolaceus TaxID=68282 RepID=A0ABW2EDS4_9ACTN|nr:HXXEE domain-containing protein [Streptomyces viridiviolaceus]GHB64692.1 membrane protein [Streptomyces viridiviolaceus]
MINSSGDEAVGGAVTLGLLAAWALHDAEELVALPGWLRRNVPVLRERFPLVPEAVWRRAEAVDAREFTVAVGVMAAVVASAAAAGRLTGGRSSAYQTALDAFGLHGLVHLAQAGLLRGYTPGAATSPLVVVPFTLWARHRLRRAGVLRPARPRDVALALGLAGAATTVSHAVARRVVGAGRNAGARR